MKTLIDNNIVIFKNISKTKQGIFVNFQVKGERGGASFTASIAVDIDAADVSAGDSLETIIERCALIGIREFQKCEFQFEGITCL